MKCANCNTVLADNLLFCTKCGKKLEKASPPPPSFQSPPQPQQVSVPKISQVWSNWKVLEVLGEGSFGKVYKAVREEHGVTTYAAIKEISIPQNESEISSLYAEGMDNDSAKTYFQGITNDFVNEIKLMETMKGTPNIVGVEDFSVQEKQDGIGWNIFIRMELLTSFNDYIKDKKLSEAEVIKLGEDILSALELCSQRKIIHRDIKPENIFVSSFGYFKLGDFGIARELEKTSGSMSQKGTYNYMAPEVAAGNQYDATVDIYSLGIMLYRLLNNNKLPFLDPNVKAIQYQDRQNAIDRRLKGEPLPLPVEASGAMSQVVLRACAFNPRERFQSPAEFKQALGAVKAGLPVPAPAASMPTGDETVAVRRAVAPPINSAAPPPHMYTNEVPLVTAPVAVNLPQKKSKAVSVLIAALCVCVLAVGGFTGLLIYTNYFANDESSQEVGGRNLNDEENNENNENNEDNQDNEDDKKEEDGDTSEEARNALEGSHRVANFTGVALNESWENEHEFLEFEFIGEFSEHPVNLVFHQSITQGEEVEAGTAITLKYSLGSEFIVLPSFDRFHSDSYRNTLIGLGVAPDNITINDQENATVSEGMVVSSNFNPGDRIRIADFPGDSSRVAQQIIIYRAVAPEFSITNDVAIAAIADVMPRYYNNYLTGINWQNSIFLSDVTPNQRDFLESRIFNPVNQNHFFEYDRIVLDLDTVNVFESNNQTRVRFNAAFHFFQTRLDGTGSRQSNQNTQVVEMVYDESSGVWLVDSGEIQTLQIGTNRRTL